jgi:spore maturation protein CgeB
VNGQWEKAVLNSQFRGKGMSILHWCLLLSAKNMKGMKVAFIEKENQQQKDRADQYGGARSN